MRPPSPRVCLIVTVLIGGGLAGWDVVCLALHRSLPPPQLHTLAAAIIIIAAVAGLLQHWFEHLIEVGQRMERARCERCNGPGHVRPDLELVSGEVNVTRLRQGHPRSRRSSHSSLRGE